jgi:hypothetical protein
VQVDDYALFFFVCFFFFVDPILAVPPPIFARRQIFWNQLSHFSNRTEPANQIPEEKWSTDP